MKTIPTVLRSKRALRMLDFVAHGPSLTLVRLLESEAVGVIAIGFGVSAMTVAEAVLARRDALHTGDADKGGV